MKMEYTINKTVSVLLIDAPTPFANGSHGDGKLKLS